MLELDSLILPFVYLFSGICFIGMHIGIRANAGFYVCKNEESLNKALNALKKQIQLFFIFLGIITICTIIFMIDNSKNPIFNALISTQWLLYLFTVLNLFFIYYQCLLCEKKQENKLLVCNEKIILIIYYFIPLNILISAVGVFFALLINTIA